MHLVPHKVVAQPLDLENPYNSSYAEIIIFNLQYALFYLENIQTPSKTCQITKKGLNMACRLG